MNPFSAITFGGQNLAPNPSFSSQLQSGATFVLPEGVFLADVGPQTCVQYKDSFSGQWKTFATGDDSFSSPLYSDGTNFRLINVSGTIQGTNVTTPGTAYTQAGTTVAFAAPAAGTPSRTATGTAIIGGSLSLAVTTAGSGYVNPIIVMPHPTLLGGTPGLCIPATFTTSLTTGGFNAITTGFAGAGYVTAPASTNAAFGTTSTPTITPANFAANPSYFLNQPNMFIIDPAGSGALLTASITNGTPTSGGVTGIIITDPGAGYDGTHIPAVTITCTGSSGTAAATALPNMSLKSVTVGGTNTGYTASIIFLSSLGASASAPLNLYDSPILARPARGTIAQSGGVLGTATIEDAGSGFQTVPLIKQVGNATADGSVNATFTAVVGGVTNTFNLWQIG